MSERCSLYRHFAVDGTLLYVGISINSIARLAQHKDASEWFGKIARVEIEKFPTRAAAMEAERVAVRKENPKHNINLRTYSPSIEKSSADLTSNVVRFQLLYREDELPLPLSKAAIRAHMDSGELGYFEMGNEFCAQRGRVRVDRWVSGWQLIDFLEWLSARRPSSRKAAA